MRPSPFTVSIAFVRGMLSAVSDAAGPAHCLSEAGIAPALLGEASARITAEQYVALFVALLNYTGDEGLGFFSRRLGRGSVVLILRNALGAGTVEKAVERLIRGLQLIQDDIGFAIARDGKMTGLVLTVPAAYYPDKVFVHEFLLRFISRLVVWLHGGPLRPVAFEFAYPRPPHADEYGKLFPGQVRFERPRSAIWFVASTMKVPMRRDEKAMREFLADLPRHAIIPYRNKHACSERLRDYLQQARPEWPGLTVAAKAMLLSVSTLQRHLASEGSSFQTVKDQLRRDLAVMRLSTSTVSLGALAAELGFSDQAVFQRAFKTWTGSAPGVYRRRA